MSQNRLAGETSPYLLQHKDNPVHWWPWGAEAFAEAKRTGKPVLLSVGYAACHWCHVMAHESFEDPEIAALMNDLFVNIKVDREERPDVDQIYMGALQQLGQQGGWPLTMFLDGEGGPFWGGTYFPPQSKYGRPGFPDVLRQISDVYKGNPDKVAHNREAIVQRLKKAARAEGAVDITLDDLNKAAGQLVEIYDAVDGGLRSAPKFPQCGLLELLWRAGERTGEGRFKATALFALDRMSEGGIYDHLGGGFARYSVDEQWLVPHFEKMLYDNAQLLELLAIAHHETGRRLFRDRAAETVGWVKREMLTADGAFAASLDADSEGHEGKFYVWTHDEILAALGPEDGAFFNRFYDVHRIGNWEGATILNRSKMGEVSDEDEDRLRPLRHKLLALREKRVHPGRDDKVLADWNGFMIAALARAGSLLGEPEWVALGADAYGAVMANMARGDRLGHSYRAGRLVFPGLASDHAAMMRAAIALHEATGEGTYLDHAVAFANELERHHLDPETGAYFLTANDGGDLIVRPLSGVDDAMPNYNATAADALVRLSTLVGDDGLRTRADRVIAGLSGQAARNILACGAFFNAVDTRLRLAEIVCVGAKREAFAAAALHIPHLHRVVMRAPDAKSAAPGSVLAARIASAPPEGAAFVCVGERCSLPVTDPAALVPALAEMEA